MQPTEPGAVTVRACTADDWPTIVRIDELAFGYTFEGSPSEATETSVRQGNLVIIAATALLVLLIARSRARLGVQGLRGESMLVDLRDRLRAHGELPELPQGWSADVVLRPAGGASFSGDFLVASKDSGDGSSSSWSTCPARVSTRARVRCCCPARSAGSSAPPLGGVPDRRQRVPRPPGLGRRLRDRRPCRLDLPTGEYMVGPPGTPRRRTSARAQAPGGCSTPPARRSASTPGAYEPCRGKLVG